MTTAYGGLQPCVVPWTPVLAVRDMTAEFWVAGCKKKERRPPLTLSHYNGVEWANQGGGRFSHFYPIPQLPTAGMRSGWQTMSERSAPQPAFDDTVLVYMGEGLIGGAPMSGCEIHLARRSLSQSGAAFWQVYRRAQSLRGKSPWVATSEYLFKHWIELPEQGGDRQ